MLGADPTAGADVAPRLAATVALVRDARGGVEVYLLHRSPTMAFAPGVWVFPGGAVDASDGEPVPWYLGERHTSALGMPAPDAQSVVIAALRELYEECGVVLGGVAPALARELREDVAGRARLARGGSYAAFAERCGVTPDPEQLRVLGRWVTPQCEPRRYDTVILAAPLPTGQEPDHATMEAVTGCWVRPADVLAEHDASPGILLPPTRWTLEQLARLRHTSDLLAYDAPVPVEPVLPTLVRDGVLGYDVEDVTWPS